MNDINFLIVNSKLQHAVLLRRELENRVSFEVFQDNNDVDVWNKMEGGKDDIYIYDRCGRLAYFIPYPLSVMASADSIVPRAIIAAYLRSPCGDTCEGNSSSAVSENNEHSSNITLHREMDLSDSQTDDHLNVSQNISSNDTSAQINPSRNNIANLFFNQPTSNNSSTGVLDNISNDILMNRTLPSDNNSLNVLPRNTRCLEADVQVCKDYSKSRLLRIQSCCMAENRGDLSCRSFTPRKCKKMQTVIKCCIKTSISDPTTTESVVELETAATLVEHQHVDAATDSDNRMPTQGSM